LHLHFNFPLHTERMEQKVSERECLRADKTPTCALFLEEIPLQEN
jgi:hypothetical protein